MNRKIILVLSLCAALMLSLLAGCSQPQDNSAAPAAPETPAATMAPTEAPAPAAESALADGEYTAKFLTDSSMFHVNETLNDEGKLTVKDGQMTIHVTLAGDSILNLYLGTAEQAVNDEANWLQPTEDTVTYGDGADETVLGFDIPVAVLDEEFDCALVGKKGKWYDHKVQVTDPRPANDAAAVSAAEGTMEVTLSGGSGKAKVESPCTVTTDENGQMWATVVWSSSKYEFMVVDGVQYDPITIDPGATFVIPVTPDTEMAVQAQTTAMSTPHLVDYTLFFDSTTLK